MPFWAWVTVTENVPSGPRQSSSIRPSIMPRMMTSSLYSPDSDFMTVGRGAQGIGGGPNNCWACATGIKKAARAAAARAAVAVLGIAFPALISRTLSMMSSATSCSIRASRRLSMPAPCSISWLTVGSPKSSSAAATRLIPPASTRPRNAMNTCSSRSICSSSPYLPRPAMSSLFRNPFQLYRWRRI